MYRKNVPKKYTEKIYRKHICTEKNVLKNVPKKCTEKLYQKNVPKKCTEKIYRKDIPMYRKNLPKNVRKKCTEKMYRKNVPKNVPKKCVQTVQTVQAHSGLKFDFCLIMICFKVPSPNFDISWPK